MLNKKRGAKRAARWLWALRLYSYSKWESLNRARMSITTSLDLKSLGIFVGIACALRGETPPCRMYSCFYLQHRSVHVPTRTFSAKLHVVALNFFGAGLFYECSCINHYLQFKFKLTAQKILYNFQMFFLPFAELIVSLFQSHRFMIIFN